MSSSVHCYYQPTPLEQVYALYLAQQVFGSAPGAPIYISGRNAVPFLTQSGLDRGLLRSVWTVADPETIGTLTHLSQFHLLLRLVSMAQAGLLMSPPAPAPAPAPAPTSQPLQQDNAMKQAVQQYATAQLALPNFSSVPLIPPQEQLMAMYGGYVMNVNVNVNNVNNNNLQPAVSFGAMSATDEQQQQQQQTFMAGAGAGAGATMNTFDSASGAHHVLPPATPAPMGFGSTATASGVLSQGSSSYDYNYNYNNNNSGSGSGMPQTSLSSVYSFGAVSATASVSDAFSDMGPAANAPLPSLETTATATATGTTTTTTTTTVGEIGGGVGAAPEHTASMTLGIPGPVLSVDDAFGEAQDAPLPSFEMATAASASISSASEEVPVVVVVEPVEHSSTFAPTNTSTGTIEEPSMMALGIPGPILSIDDAFGEAQDAPLPSMQALIPDAVPENAEDDNDDDDDDDDFGDFEGVPSAAPTSSGDTFGATPPAPLGVSDAFGAAMVDVSDAPLPSLLNQGEAPQPTAAAVVVKENDDDDDDDFGGFETAVAASETVVPADDDFGGFEEAVTDSAAPVALPDALGDFATSQPPSAIVAMEQPMGDNSLLGSVGPLVSVGDAFGSLEVQDAPLPALDQFGGMMGDPEPTTQANVEMDDNDDFGDFEGTTGNYTIPQIEVPAVEAPILDVVVAPGQSADAFAVIPELTDGPLPQPGATIEQSPSDPDFGGFQDVPQSDAPESDTAPAPELPAPMVFDQAVISGAGTVQSMASFSGMSATGSGGADPNDPFSAFDSISGPTQAELPPLSNASDAPITIADEYMDDFGDFGGATSDDVDQPTNLLGDSLLDVGPVATEVENAESGLNAEPADPFSAFDSIAPTSDSQLPELSPAPPAADNPVISTVDANAQDDEFGAFDEAPVYGENGNAPVAAAPVMPLPEARSGDDDFGDFGGAIESPAGFGGFEDVSASQPGEFQTAQEPIRSVSNEREIFNDFGGAPVSFSSNNGDFGDDSASPSRTLEAAPQLQGGSNEQDLFGDFGGAPTTSDDAAEFSNFSGEPASPTDALEPVPPQTQISSNEQDLFGDFDEDRKEEADDFGDFSGFSAPQSGSLDPISPQPQSGSNEQDLFGDFGAAPESYNDLADDFVGFTGASAPQPGSLDPTTTQIQPGSNEEDVFGGLEAAQKASENSVDDFGDFTSVSASHSGSIEAAPVQTPPGADDEPFGDFGDAAPDHTAGYATKHGDEFAAFESAAEAKLNDIPTKAGEFGDFISQPQPVDQEDDFGDFGSAPEGTVHEAATMQQPSADGDFGDFGSFDQAPASSNPVGSSQLEQQSPDDDWGDFENVASAAAPADNFGAVSGGSDLQGKREQIRALSAQLPESLLRQAGLSGDHVDLGECFEVNIGMDSQLNTQKQQRVDRCIQILERLSKSHKKIECTYWEQVLNVVKEELVFGNSLLSDATKLSPGERSELLKPLQTMIAGFAEYTRVTRSIVATVGDLMMLDASALLTIDTWASTWCSVSILEITLEIEKLWKSIQKQMLGLFPEVFKSLHCSCLEEIRSNYSESFAGDKHCQLTFQPLNKKDKKTTKAAVSWQGKHFMACSANLLANKCPFYIVAE